MDRLQWQRTVLIFGVDDPRFEFSRSFLRLKPDAALSLQDSAAVTVKITLVDRTDSSRVFREDLVITVRENSIEFFDYGDAPFRFGTTRGSDGPRHQISELSLGRRIDAEAEGQNQYQALGDDIDAQGDDEVDQLQGLTYWYALSTE